MQRTAVIDNNNDIIMICPADGDMIPKYRALCINVIKVTEYEFAHAPPLSEYGIYTAAEWEKRAADYAKKCTQARGILVIRNGDQTVVSCTESRMLIPEPEPPAPIPQQPQQQRITKHRKSATQQVPQPSVEMQKVIYLCGMTGNYVVNKDIGWNTADSLKYVAKRRTALQYNRIAQHRFQILKYLNRAKKNVGLPPHDDMDACIISAQGTSGLYKEFVHDVIAVIDETLAAEKTGIRMRIDNLQGAHALLIDHSIL